MKKKAIVLALVFSAGVLVSASTEAGIRMMNGVRLINGLNLSNGVHLGNGIGLGNGLQLGNGLSSSTTGLDFTTIGHHRLGK